MATPKDGVTLRVPILRRSFSPGPSVERSAVLRQRSVLDMTTFSSIRNDFVVVLCDDLVVEFDDW